MRPRHGYRLAQKQSDEIEHATARLTSGGK